MSTTTSTVVGMTCDHCVRTVTAEVSRIPATDIEVDPAFGDLTVWAAGPIDDAAFAPASGGAGHRVQS